MSMRSSFVYGFGFEVENVLDRVLLDFMINHRNTFCKTEIENELFCEVVNFTDEDLYAYGLEDFFESYSCDCSGQEGCGAIISNIISRETGIRVQYEMGQSECCSYPSVLFTETYPWLCNEKEKNLTIESLTEILLPYAEELGLSKDDIDALEIEYYG